MRSLASVRRAREKEKQRQTGAAARSKPKVVRDVVIPETITVQELANRMAERGADVIKALMKMGVMATINQTIDADTAELIVDEFGHRVQARRRRPTSRSASTGDDDDAERRCSRARRSSPSWATSTTARPRCSTRCARPTWRRARPAASPSISAPIR